MSKMAQKKQENALQHKADEYLRKHRIVELLQDLCSDLCFEQPPNVNEFLIERLKMKQKQGFRTGIFSKDEINNIFILFDLKREGKIDRERCKQALKTLANNEYQLDKLDATKLPEQIDQHTFLILCQTQLGIKS